MNANKRWVWLDMEMSGLDPNRHRVLEIATVVTDTQLQVVAEGPDIVVHQPQEVLDDMDEWCTQTHGRNGLTQKVKNSPHSVQDAERETLNFLRNLVPPGEAPLCGNSIGQDRRFLYRYMPDLASFFHYRNLDVSTLKILAQEWAPQRAGSHEKHGSHRARDDIYDSIEELRFYRSVLLRLDRP